MFLTNYNFPLKAQCVTFIEGILEGPIQQDIVMLVVEMPLMFMPNDVSQNKHSLQCKNNDSYDPLICFLQARKSFNLRDACALYLYMNKVFFN